MIAGERPRWARAFAPATVANVAVGFDVLGHALCGAGDRATLRRDDSGTVRIAAVRGVVTDLPADPQQNTAGRALLSLLRHAPRGVGFVVELDKGVPLGSGMGGSSASAVAALVAANALLPSSLPLAVLYDCALDGEAAASGSRHGDNVAPALLGGLAIAPHAGEPVRVPVPASLWTAVVHPHFVLETRRARQALAGSYELPQFVAQSEALALVVTGCCTGDLALIGRGLRDVLVEPRRAPLIPGFAAVKAAALASGALGAAIAGAGPSVFAWCADEGTARSAAAAMQSEFAAAGQRSDVLVSPVDAPGAMVEACGS